MTTNDSKNSLSLATLITEGVALFCVGLAFTTEYWPADDATLLPGIVGAVLMFLAACMGIISAAMLMINLFRRRIDIKVIISMLPFLGFAVWGIWYSYADPVWVHNLPIFWGLTAVIGLILIFMIFWYAKSRR